MSGQRAITVEEIIKEVISIPRPLSPLRDPNDDSHTPSNNHHNTPADTSVLIHDETANPWQYDNYAQEESMPSADDEDDIPTAPVDPQNQQHQVIVVNPDTQDQPPQPNVNEVDVIRSQQPQHRIQNEIQSVRATRQLQKFRTYNKFKVNYAHYDRAGDRCVLISGVTQNSTDEILKVPIPFAYPRSRIFGNEVNPTVDSNNQELSISIDRVGRVADFCSPSRYKVQTVDVQHSSNNVLLGHVTGQSWWKCDLSYTAEIDMDNNILNLPNAKYFFKPQGRCVCTSFSLCNSCFMKVYLIYDETNQKVGSMTCGVESEIEINLEGFDEDPFNNVVKALLLSAALTIFELYFAPRCCGIANVGRMGTSKFFCVLIVAINLAFLMFLLYFYYKELLPTFF